MGIKIVCFLLLLFFLFVCCFFCCCCFYKSTRMFFICVVVIFLDIERKLYLNIVDHTRYCLRSKFQW